MTLERFLGAVFSVFFWTYIGLSSALLFPVGVLIWLATKPFDPQLRFLHRFTCGWAYHYVRLVPFWRVRIEGAEKIPEDRAAVLVANHQSLGDILVLFGLFRHFKWVSKASVFAVPFIGWNMSLNEYIGIRRGQSRSIARMLDRCREHLRAKNSLLLFPEGTRSPDGEIKRFKAGAFSLAHDEMVPVIPIVLEGTQDILPKRGLFFRQVRVQHVNVRVLDPIGPDPTLEVAPLRTRVRSVMVDALAASADPIRS